MLAWPVVSVVLCLVSVVLCLGYGGFDDGRRAETAPFMVSLSWAISLLVGSVLSFAAGGIMHMAGSAVSAMASVAGAANT